MSVHPGFFPVIAVTLFLAAAGFSVVYLETDDSNAINEGFTFEKNGDEVTVTGHGTLEYDDTWDGFKTLTLNVNGGTASINGGGFNGCDSLETVTVNGPLDSIGGFAFFSCDYLTTVTIDGSVGSIGDGAFQYCVSLTTVTIDGSVGSIGVYTFKDLNCLTTVTIDGSVGSIGDGAFYNCKSLPELTIAGPITTPIGENAFVGCHILETINIACNDPWNITTGSTDNGYIAFNAGTVNHVHRYSAAYDWTTDGSTCIVHINCLNDSALISDEHPDVTSAVKIQPTETEMGTTEYSVSGTFDGFAYSDTKDI